AVVVLLGAVLWTGRRRKAKAAGVAQFAGAPSPQNVPYQPGPTPPAQPPAYTPAPQYPGTPPPPPPRA
ncbi:MAG: hypothetical protein M1144_04000, partial [Candidatus Thermoplasmatota archaeon]|nr:hypothetical protein [Candidatus Thermoplasmatota archaeon]